MSLATAIAIYFIIWWTVLFAVLRFLRGARKASLMLAIFGAFFLIWYGVARHRKSSRMKPRRRMKGGARLKTCRLTGTNPSRRCGTSSAVLIRKGSPELQAAINKALADIKKDGTYAKISQKYFGKDVSQ